jgi:hypothetical protein
MDVLAQGDLCLLDGEVEADGTPRVLPMPFHGTGSRAGVIDFRSGFPGGKSVEEFQAKGR